MKVSQPLSATHVKIGEAVDQLVTVDLSARGFITILYDESRKLAGDVPLCLTAAREIAERTTPGQPVVIATGLPIRGWFGAEMAENDGPIGAASLARACYIALQAVPILLCEAEQQHVLRACLRAVGMTPTTFEQYEAARRSPHAVPGRDLPIAIVHGFTAKNEEVDAASKRILDYAPSALVSIERQGMTEEGHYHYGRGEKNIPGIFAKIDRLFEIAKQNGFFTVGIGDGGNELGMANIRDVIRQRLPFGDKIAPSVEVSLLVSASVSNFGCYGIEACLAAITGNLNVLHSPEQEVALIEACVREGAVDGVTGFIEPFVDALPVEVCAGLVSMLRATVKNGLTPSKIFQVANAN
ncbi:MAG: D-glutamate cyclase [Variibacter sp.]|nr:D-glutamate cyclase [Variibacter sp.]